MKLYLLINSFCSTSYTGISQLTKCFKNLRGLQDLQLTIRRCSECFPTHFNAPFRVNETNETDALVPFFSRFHKIKKLYLELVAYLTLSIPNFLFSLSQHGIEEDGHINLIKGVSKCHSLKSLHCKFLK